MGHFTGSIFVTAKARTGLQAKLSTANSRFLEDIDYICECFDKTTKPRFKDPNGAVFIKFGRPSDKDMKLAGTEVAEFFEPSIQSIIEAVVAQVIIVNYVPLKQMSALIPKAKRRGPGDYYHLAYSIVLSFGLTELKAQIARDEDGVEKRGQAEIIYGDTTALSRINDGDK
ncbi:hypothetical protein D9758_010769 [Tetrapyrgos nigripes]|uniref:Uncharacterized protein n=1 Tax=Tetrapyrgos nigripes TaxID=182062 RepID=A0A8H5D7X8_9AGAR|nr:hypothetical protein D9758_010769 [Tetrapyrgos nigripes]